MDPFTALGTASSIIQIVDFSARLLSRSRQLYAHRQLDAHKALEQASRNLADLVSRLPEPDFDNALERSRTNDLSLVQHVQRQARHTDGAGKGNGPNNQLVVLSNEVKDISQSIRQAMGKTRQNVSGRRRVWSSIYEALRSVWGDQEINQMAQRLDQIRKEVDTALLFSLKQHIMKQEVQYHQDRASEQISPRDHAHIKAFLTELRSRGEIAASSLEGIARIASATRFWRMIKGLLEFREMPDRQESIPEAHKKTFQWIYDRNQPIEPDSSEDSRSEVVNYVKWDSFSKWLEDPDANNVYWITGKPGSGKSTLMKYLYNNPHTRSGIQAWSTKTGRGSVVYAGFFFWNSGTTMQMSRLGLIQTLLYESITQLFRGMADTDTDEPEVDRLLQAVFQERWERYETLGGDFHPFAWPELRRSLIRLVSNRERNFFFVVDGLDEFDGDSAVLVDFISDLSKHSNVKICTASRFWPVFEDAFELCPRLHVQLLTIRDIRKYVSSKFRENKRYRRLAARDPPQAKKLILDVVDKSSGVFLWVYLVVKSLLQGISNGDRASDLQARLDDLPSDLIKLFGKLLDSIEKDEYFRHACQIIRLMKEHSSPTLLDLSFADDEDTESGIRARCGRITPSEVQQRVEDMERRLNSRCRGLFEVHTPFQFNATKLMPTMAEFDNRTSVGQSDPESLRVVYLHRTAREFLHSESVWRGIMQATSNPPFDPCQYWANGYLWSLKQSRALSDERSSPCIRRVWVPGTWCMEFALRMQEADGSVRLKYLEQVGKAMLPTKVRIEEQLKDWPSAFKQTSSPIQTFMDIAILFSLDGYVRAKMEQRNVDLSRKFRKKGEWPQVEDKSHSFHTVLLEGRNCLQDINGRDQQRLFNDLEDYVRNGAASSSKNRYFTFWRSKKEVRQKDTTINFI